MLKAAQIFSSNMVLQRDKNILVWGSGEDGKTVRVTVGDNSAEGTVKDGRWKVLLSPMAAGGAYDMVITDGVETVTFVNVMVGEVWFCGGQSNMELELQNAKDGQEYLSRLDESTPIRYYYTPKVATAEEAEEQGKISGWNTAGPESSKAWSAVGYHFAAKLAKELGVTVGLIGCNWGGTSASSWVDRKTLENDKTISSYIEEYDEKNKGKSLEEQLEEYKAYQKYDAEWFAKQQEILKTEPDIGWDELQERIGKNQWPGPINAYNPFRPTNMFENMVMRVCPYTIKGFLYYQGESDDHKPDSYYRLFTALIALWREKWGDDTLPFIMVQLPMFKYAADPDWKHWCKIRSAQMKAYRTVKNTGIAVILDCGEFNEIHPKDKLPVGERLCLQAEKVAYGMKVDADGPIFRGYVIKGSEIELSFDYAENGFDIRGDKPLGFEVAGEDGEFRPADVRVEGSVIRVSSPEVEKPVYASYNWYNYAEVNVFGKNGLPLAPFNLLNDC
mgnify:CR=1 FL=1